MKEKSDFAQQVASFGIKLTENQEEKFKKYYELLIKWNKVMNLTGIIEREEVYVKHFLDSLSMVKVINLNKEKRVLDIGTGAGFPGIPLKIAFPDLEIVLMDSLRKRVDFLEEVVKELELEGVLCLHGRAEDLDREEGYRQSFDVVTSRAVADMRVLCEYTLPFVVLGGSFVAYKTINSEEEIQGASEAIEILGGTLKDDIVFELPGTDLSRRLVRVEKTMDTPEKYPRRAGKPEKKPL